MDDILASIRRIMLDEQARLQDSPAAGSHGAERPPFAREEEPVLILDSSMAVGGGDVTNLIVSPMEETVVMISAESAEAPAEPLGGERTPEARPEARYPIMTETVPSDAATGDAAMPVAHPSGPSAHTTILAATGLVPVAVEPAGHEQPVLTPQAIEALMAPAAAAAAAASVEALLKQLTEERIASLQPAPPPSPTIEEIVRSELRPFLKAWLDEHLPPMVERLVRAEISRLIGRSGL